MQGVLVRRLLAIVDLLAERTARLWRRRVGWDRAAALEVVQRQLDHAAAQVLTVRAALVKHLPFDVGIGKVPAVDGRIETRTLHSLPHA